MTHRWLSPFLALLVLAGATTLSGAQTAQNPRIALVIGESAYPDSALATPANDAALVAQTLQAAGFDVVGARDLDEKSVRGAMRDFLAKAAAIGPSMQAFVYLSGRGVQYEGDNFLVPVDAQIARDSDVPIEAVRIADFVHALAAEPGQARILVIDAARANPYAAPRLAAGGRAGARRAGRRLAPGVQRLAGVDRRRRARSLRRLRQDAGGRVARRRPADRRRLRPDARGRERSDGRRAEFRGAHPSWRRPISSSSAPPTRRRRRRKPRSPTPPSGRSAASPPIRPMRPPSSATRSPATRNSSPPIPPASRPSACARSSPRAARRCSGAERWRRTARRPTGPI